LNKGICFHFGYVYNNIEKQVKDIKNAGFNCVMDSADASFECENGVNSKRIKLFNRYGLKPSSLHSTYNRKETPEFWKENAVGEKIEKSLIKDVEYAYNNGFSCVVVHLCGEEANQIGFCRLRRILLVCEKLNIPLALENLNRNFNLLSETFKNVKSDYLKFCWDVGHNNAYDPDIDYFTAFKDKLIALHLHDNLGAGVPNIKYAEILYDSVNPDMHTLNKYGNINWKLIAKKIAKIKYPINLDYEVMMGYRQDETPQEVLSEVYKQACELEKMIEEYKKQPKL